MIRTRFISPQTSGFLTVICMAMAVISSVSLASTQKELERAKDKGLVAFVLVTEPGADGEKEAEQVVREAVKATKRSVMIRLDRTTPENGELVSRYRLIGPQIPLVLVFAPNGAVAGGGLAQGMTTDRLMGMVPTKKEVELIGILQSGKGVVILVSRKGMAGEDEAIGACEKAREMSLGGLGVVRVDMDDKAEQGLLGKLRITGEADQPVTVVINSSGQIGGSFSGPANPRDLVVASAKKAGGCCPGGKKAGAACPAPAK